MVVDDQRAGTSDGLERRGNPLKAVNVVVTCTKRKRFTPHPKLRLRDIEAKGLREGFAKWRERLEESCAETISARNLYSGDHWSVVRSLETVSLKSNLLASIWVCSAGYGLVGMDADVRPYSATFSSDHPDSVQRLNQFNSPLCGKMLWWGLHQEMSGPESSKPRSISQVAAAEPDNPLFVVASKEYLRAMCKDVELARAELNDPELLCIISSGTRRLPRLESNILPTSAVLQASVGGSLHSLNARLLRRILDECDPKGLTVPTLRSRIERWPKMTQEGRRPVGRRMADIEVRRYISEGLTEDRHASWSSLLRRLRDSGRACKQERFAGLFQSEKARMNVPTGIHRNPRK